MEYRDRILEALEKAKQDYKLYERSVLGEYHRGKVDALEEVLQAQDTEDESEG